MAAAITTTPPTGGPGGSGGLGGAGRGMALDTKADRAQLTESPVSLRRILALFTPHSGALLAVTVMLVATSLLGLASPFLVREVIDTALPNGDTHLLVRCVVAMVAIAAASSALGVGQTWLSTKVGQQIMHRLRTDVFAHLQRQSLGFFTRTRGGEIQSRLTNDIGGAQSFVTNTATALATNVTTVIGTAVAMVALSWRLSLISLIVLPPAVWVSRKVAETRKSATRDQQRLLATMQVQIEEGLSVSGVRLAKTMGASQLAADRFAATSEGLVDIEMRSQLAGRWRMSTLTIVFAAIPAALYLAAGFPVVTGASGESGGGLSIGTLVAFIALQSNIFRPIMMLLQSGVQIVASMALFSRIFGYLDLPVEVPEPEHPVALDPARVAGHLTLTDVGFTYPDGHSPALSGIDLDIPAGSSLAVVGATGSGKSTLLSLIPRLVDPSTGSVRIDGIDVRELSFADLARIVGVVSQESYLLHASIRDNLRYADPDASDERLWQVLRAARLDGFVAALPAGLNTIVGARGQRLSGGEQQRLAIARTLLRDPRVLVLDEATSALDNTTEAQVQAALDELSTGRTTITIAHRLSTVRHADRIVVLDHGRIVESGTHDELVTADGAYSRLALRR